MAYYKSHYRRIYTGISQYTDGILIAPTSIPFFSTQRFKIDNIQYYWEYMDKNGWSVNCNPVVLNRGQFYLLGDV